MTQIILFETLIVGTVESIYLPISFTDEILKPSDMKLQPSSIEVTATLADMGIEPRLPIYTVSILFLNSDYSHILNKWLLSQFA